MPQQKGSQYPSPIDLLFRHLTIVVTMKTKATMDAYVLQGLRGATQVLGDKRTD
jgi:hypothetical protein